MVEPARSLPEIPPYHQMMWPTLQAIIALGDSGSIQEINDKAVAFAHFSDAQQNVLHQGGPSTEIHYRMAWARSYLKAVGALENSARGVWAITDHGKSLTQGDMDAIPALVRAHFSARKSSRQDADVQREPIAEASDESELAHTLPDPEWNEQLLDVLQAMDPGAFEKLAQRVLRESGFTQVEVTGKSGDGGIDGVGVLRIALLSFQVFFQCKRYTGSVGASAVRDFRGAIWGRTEKGLLITTGSFTVEAKREATRDGVPAIELIDGDALCDLLKSHNLGVTTEMVERVTIDPDWFAAI